APHYVAEQFEIPSFAEWPQTLEVRLSPASTASVRVALPDGTPGPSALVALSRRPPHSAEVRQLELASLGDQVHTARCDAVGLAVFDAVEAGRWFIALQLPPGWALRRGPRQMAMESPGHCDLVVDQLFYTAIDII